MINRGSGYRVRFGWPRHEPRHDVEQRRLAASSDRTAQCQARRMHEAVIDVRVQRPQRDRDKFVRIAKHDIFLQDVMDQA